MKEKCVYNRPFMRVEQFVPNEFTSTCWYVESGNCYDNLVHDLYDGLGRPRPNGDWNPGGGDIALARNHGTNHKIPDEEGVLSFKEEEVAIPTNINTDNNYWDRPYLWTPLTALQNRITTPIYHIKYKDVDHYFKAYKTCNHS